MPPSRQMVRGTRDDLEYRQVSRKLGVWTLGAYGNVAATVVAGAASIARGLNDPTGLITATSDFADLDLIGLGDLVFGGHEIRKGSVLGAARDFGKRNGVLTPALILAVEDALTDADANVRPGVLLDSGDEVRQMASEDARTHKDPKDLVARVQADIREFQERHGLDDVIVVNLTSTEPRDEDVPALRSAESFEKALRRGRLDGVPSSVLYAYAAVQAGYPFIDFTPSPAAGAAPVRAAAKVSCVPHMGRDGKTGETLVKTVLAPMFMARNLRVLSWEGVNMLGNRDGAVLRGKGALASKISDKDEALRRILGTDDTHSRVHIDYVPSLEDWKQAYDFIHFEGFLGARMQMHFLWQGCDSALAAPLVLDLVRLTDLAHRRGETGTLPHLACFFKTPIDVEVQDFAEQVGLLREYVGQVNAERVGSAAS